MLRYNKIESEERNMRNESVLMAKTNFSDSILR